MLGERIEEEARKRLGKPFALGCHGPDYFDCSGLVRDVLEAAGVSLGLPGSYNRLEDQNGKLVRALMKALAEVPGPPVQGDVLFLEPIPGRLEQMHLAITTSSGTAIHASGDGRVMRVVETCLADSFLSKVARVYRVKDNG